LNGGNLADDIDYSEEEPYRSIWGAISGGSGILKTATVRNKAGMDESHKLVVLSAEGVGGRAATEDRGNAFCALERGGRALDRSMLYDASAIYPLGECNFIYFL
jgi:hypothetical protein